MLQSFFFVLIIHSIHFMHLFYIFYNYFISLLWICRVFKNHHISIHKLNYATRDLFSTWVDHFMLVTPRLWWTNKITPPYLGEEPISQEPNGAISVSHDAAQGRRERGCAGAARGLRGACAASNCRFKTHFPPLSNSREQEEGNESRGWGGPTYLSTMLHNNSSVPGSASAVGAQTEDARRPIWSDLLVPRRHPRCRSRVRMMKCGENGSKCRRA